MNAHTNTKPKYKVGDRIFWGGDSVFPVTIEELNDEYILTRRLPMNGRTFAAKRVHRYVFDQAVKNGIITIIPA